MLYIFESLLDSKEIKPVDPKGNQPWIFIGRTDAEAPILWPHEGKSQLIAKNPDTGKDWRQKDKGQQRMRWLDSISYSGDMNSSRLGDREGQESLACCSPWGHKNQIWLDYRLNSNNKFLIQCKRKGYYRWFKPSQHHHCSDANEDIQYNDRRVKDYEYKGCASCQNGPFNLCDLQQAD